MTQDQTISPHRNRGWRIATWVLFFILVSVLFGLVSLRLGRDVNWDLKNYHYYNAYAFFENRMGLDIAPAQLQTFFNPLLDLPFYWLVRHFPSPVAGFVLGFFHGINVSLVFLIFWFTARIHDQRLKFLAGLGLACVSSLAPGFISELGNTMNDNLTSLFVLAALLTLMLASRRQARAGLILIGLAGAILGLGIGLKPTIAVFAIGSAAGLSIFPAAWREKLRRLLVYGLAGLAGVLASTGWWWWNLFSRYSNPLLPYFNNIFKSAFIAPFSYVDNIYLPVRIWEYFAWPFIFSINAQRVNPIGFHDVRFGLLYALVLVWLVIALLKKFRPGWLPAILSADIAPTGEPPVFDHSLGNFLLASFLVSFCLWELQSANYRYIISLELLVPLCFLIILERLLRPRRLQIAAALLALVLMLAFFRPFNWTRLEWDDPYFKVNTNRFNTTEPVLVVMLGNSPTSYVIPEFPHNFRFLRPEGNLILWHDYGIIQQVRDEIQKHTGPMYILYNKDTLNQTPEKSLTGLGLAWPPQDCFKLKINTPDYLEMCPVTRLR